MVRTPDIKPEGQTLEIPNEKADEMPIQVSYSQAKKIAKSIRPPMSEKQKAHVQKLVELNKKRWEERRKAKEDEEIKLSETKTKIVVKPKRIYSRKPRIIKATESDEEVEESEESSDEYQKKPRRKNVTTRTESPAVVEKVQKATHLLETVNKLDNAIMSLKKQGGRYDSILASKFKF